MRIIAGFILKVLKKNNSEDPSGLFAVAAFILKSFIVFIYIFNKEN